MADELDLVERTRLALPRQLRTLDPLEEPETTKQIGREAPLKDVWQTIDSAPKDGEWVLLFAPESTEPQSFVAQWRDDELNPWGGGWYSDHDDDGRVIDVDPSHWQPRPAPPAKQALSPSMTDAKTDADPS